MGALDAMKAELEEAICECDRVIQRKAAFVCALAAVESFQRATGAGKLVRVPAMLLALRRVRIAARSLAKWTKQPARPPACPAPPGEGMESP